MTWNTPTHLTPALKCRISRVNRSKNGFGVVSNMHIWGNVIVIPRGCGSSSDSGQAWHQSCRDVDDMEPGDIYFYVEKHRLLKKKMLFFGQI